MDARAGGIQTNFYAILSQIALKEQWQRSRQSNGILSTQGGIAYIDDLEAAAIQLRTFADRIRRATRGYSRLFEATKINQEELAQSTSTMQPCLSWLIR